jgi:transposase
MSRRVLTVERVQEVQRLIGEGLSNRQIARVLKMRRERVGEIRGMEREEAIRALSAPPAMEVPFWALSIAWPQVVEEIGRGFEIKRIWEERAQAVTSYSNFWKYLKRCYPALLKDTVTLREFSPGTHCEVDWAGDTIAYQEVGGHLRKAHVFVGILCFSQKIFAHAFEDEKKSAWLLAHQKMYASFGGVPHVTVPDNLKTGTKKAHRYDPDLNPSYVEMASHYRTAIVPARVASPKDKALVENAVGIVMRLFRFRNRHRKFFSLTEINESLAEIVAEINVREHSRLKTSRLKRWQEEEVKNLKPLPDLPFEEIDWKIARVHPDSTVACDQAFYSVPHLHRGKEVRVKMTARHIEVFFGLERIALHPRDRCHRGVRILNPDHLPPQAKAYRETTPQHLLSQARFLSSALHDFIDHLFQEDALGHIRRAQGLIRHAREEIARFGKTEAEPRIQEAISWMKLFGKTRVVAFAERLKSLRSKTAPDTRNNLQRKPGNPMLRKLTDERRTNDGTDTIESPDDRTQTSGHEHAVRSNLLGGQTPRDDDRGDFRHAPAGGGGSQETGPNMESDQILPSKTGSLF